MPCIVTVSYTHLFGIGGISIPNYCLSLILIGIFSVNLRLLPSTGMHTRDVYKRQMEPHSGVGGEMPNPRKLKPEADRMLTLNCVVQ